MVYDEPVKVTIDSSGLVEVIIDMVVQHSDLTDSIISDQGSIFMSKFWFSLCYFLGIKKQLFIAFYPQTNRQTEQQNSTIEAYFSVFVNCEQNDWAQFLSMGEFAYNNSKNPSMGHTPFKLNCGYYPWVSFKNKCNACSRSFLANRLAIELRKLMNDCRQNLLYTQDL